MNAGSGGQVDPGAPWDGLTLLGLIGGTVVVDVAGIGLVRGHRARGR